ADGKLQWIPWDHSFAFSTGGGIGGASPSLGLDEVTDTWPLIRFLLDDETYRARYRHYLARVIEQEYTPEAYTEAFTAARDLIEPYVTGPEGEQPGYTFQREPDAFTQAVEQLVTHVTNRQAEVKAYLQTAQ
ncbi:MAG TPA: CotH kinase family protein, partial [Polyangiales bacterium]|nr:CotH kinase family protein [Polyangiales bacterium]